jgi:hypothetical protein
MDQNENVTGAVEEVEQQEVPMTPEQVMEQIAAMQASQRKDTLANYIYESLGAFKVPAKFWYHSTAAGKSKYLPERHGKRECERRQRWIAKYPAEFERQCLVQEKCKQKVASK